MICSTCNNEMQTVGYSDGAELSWCPNCGSLRNHGFHDTPYLTKQGVSLIILEREACAKLVEEISIWPARTNRKVIADAIRQRADIETERQAINEFGGG